MVDLMAVTKSTCPTNGSSQTNTAMPNKTTTKQHYNSNNYKDSNKIIYKDLLTMSNNDANNNWSEPRNFLLSTCLVLCLLLTTMCLGIWNFMSISNLQDEVRVSLSGSSSGILRDLEARIQELETHLAKVVEEVEEEREIEGDDYDADDLEEFQLLEDEHELLDPPQGRRRKRSPETIRRPSRYMRRPVPVYNKAYGINIREGEGGLQLYSSLQGPFDDNSVSADSEELRKKQPAERSSHRPVPASLLKNGVRRRRPQLKSLQRRRQDDATPSGGLVINRDVLYRASLYKDTPGEDDWDAAAVSRVRQGGARGTSSSSSSSLTQARSSAAPIFVRQTQRDRPRKRPRKKNNNRRRRRGSRITAAHFNGLPDAAGGSSDGMWEGAEWMEGLGLMSRYKTGGDHVMVAEPGIYLIYAQVKYAYGRSSGFDIKVNGRSEASCSQLLNNSQPTTCHTSVVAYLPKNSVVRLESNSPISPVLSLGDGEEASMGLVKLLDAPDTYHKLFN